jgi:histone-lysine N-methyltransferase SETMAR
MSEIETRVVIKFLWRQGKTNKQIHAEMMAVEDFPELSLRTIQKWTQRFNENNLSLEDTPRSGRPKDERIRTRIAEYMDHEPYASAREIANHLECDKNTVTKILRDELHMTKVNIRWIPKDLSDAQKSERVRIATQMLATLSDREEYKYVFTQDETWIYLSNPRKMMWISSGSTRPRAEKRAIGARKVMISVIFNQCGFASIVMLPPGETINKIFFADEVIADFVENIKIPKPSSKKNNVKLHCDNAPAHRINDTIRDLNISRFPHPPYSPDLAPCDFFLFGYLQTMLEGKYFEDEIELLAEVQLILRSIPKATLLRVYDEWVARLHRCIEIHGNYVE